ncbi:MAG: CHAT domain-containing protein [Cyanobacteria bacterium P01_A01_bin.83]
MLATRDLYPKGNIPQEVIDRLDALRQAAIVKERRLNQQRDRRNGFGGFSMGDSRGLGGVVDSDEALNRDRLNQIRQELDNLVKEHIQPVDPSFQLTQKVEPISFEKIKEALPTEQTVLVEWFIGNGTLSAFIVTRQQETPVHFDYTEEQFQALDEVVNQYYDSYRKRDGEWHSSLPSLLTQLAQNLQLETIIEQIKELVTNCDRLIIVPHRWLHLLPIHALPLANGQCLLDLFPNGVNYAPSIQLLELTQKQVRENKKDTNFFAVQNPTNDLKFTDIEVKSIRSQFQPKDDVLKQQEATKLALTKERLGQANLTHFSCHGQFDFENPELSRLLLADSKVDEGEEEDKKDKGEKIRFLPNRDGKSIDLEKCLTLGEIFGLDLRKCRLVTLSACETGITDFRSLSDEYIGLPSGFLYAGSPSVVSSLWAVNDLSTSFLMIKFYQNLQEIDSVPVALNKAQLWLRSATKEELYSWGESLPLPIYEKRPYLDSALRKLPPNSVPYASPFYWAAFCAVGQ